MLRGTEPKVECNVRRGRMGRGDGGEKYLAIGVDLGL